MNDKDELRIASFFNEYGKKDIVDNGFSERVMSQLPRRERSPLERLNIVWTTVCGVAIVAAFFILGGVKLVSTWLLNIFVDLQSLVLSANINLLSILSAYVALSLIILFAIYQTITNDEENFEITMSR